MTVPPPAPGPVHSRRRHLLVLLSACAPGALVSRCARPSGCPGIAGYADPSQRAMLRYEQASSVLGQRCEGCRLYRPSTDRAAPCGGCTVVRGPVDAGGWCTAWVAREQHAVR